MAEVDYQKAGQVRQLLAERANVVAYGDTARVEAIDRELADLGHVEEKPKVAKDEAPAGRSTKQAARQQTTARAQVAEGKGAASGSGG